MVIRPQNLLMLQDRFRCLTVIDLRYQASPGADTRLEHDGIPQGLDRLQGRLGGKGHHITWHWHVMLNERLGGKKFVAADTCYISGVDRLNAPIVKYLQRIEGTRVVDRAFENHIILLIRPGI